MRWLYLAVSLAIGCSGNQSAPLELTLDVEPLVLEYRAGDAATWIRPPKSNAGGSGGVTYELHGNGDLEIVYVCEPNPSEYYSEELDVLSDEWSIVSQSWPYQACGSNPTSGQTFNVTGEMVQPGSIYAGVAEADSNTGPWQFQVMVAPGNIDLVGIDSSQIAIRRNQPIQGSFVEPTLDLSVEGMPYSSAAFSVSGTEVGETMLTYELYITSNGTLLSLASSPTSVTSLPTGLTLKGDVYSMTVLSYNSTEARGVYGTYPSGIPPSVSLLPVLENISYDLQSVSANWSSLPMPYTTAGFSYQDSSNTQGIEASSGWIAEHGVNALSFDSSFPDNNASYSVVANSSKHQFGVTVVSPGTYSVVYTSGIMDSGSVAAPDYNLGRSRRIEPGVAPSHVDQ